MLRVMGLDELIAPDMDAYVATAVGLAGDPARLASLRATVARGRDTGPLYDTARLTRHVELAYERMMGDYCAGRAPSPFAVTAQPSAGPAAPGSARPGPR